jgi:hypothetical protein
VVVAALQLVSVSALEESEVLAPNLPSPLVGPDCFATMTAIESPAAPAIKLVETVTVADSPADIAEVVADNVKVSEEATMAAFAGIHDINPSPRVETTTSAIRLKVNFDIYSLSIVVFETFSNTAGKEELFAL